MPNTERHWVANRITSILGRLIWFVSTVVMIGLAARFLAILFQAGINTSLFSFISRWLFPLRQLFFGWTGEVLIVNTWHIDFPSILALFAIAVISEILQWILRIGTAAFKKIV